MKYRVGVLSPFTTIWFLLTHSNFSFVFRLSSLLSTLQMPPTPHTRTTYTSLVSPMLILQNNCKRLSGMAKRRHNHLFLFLAFGATIITSLTLRIFETTTASTISREQRFADTAVEARLEKAYLDSINETIPAHDGLEKDTETRNKQILPSKTKTTTKDSRPRLIIHVGPAKTGTTTLQTSFTYLKDSLRRDNLDYQGRFYRPFVDAKGNYILNRTSSSLLEGFRALRYCSDKRKCVLEVKEILQRHRGYPRNILLSDETFDSWKAEDYELLREILSEEWQVEVLVVYRRYYEWLLSKKYQFERLDYTNPRKTRWPRGKGGPRPVFPDWIEKDIPSPAFVARQVNGTFPLLWANLHSKDGVVGDTVCNALAAEKACAKTLDLSKGRDNVVMNKAKDGTDLRYYDSIAVGAKDMINISAFSRPYIRKAVQSFHEKGKSLTLQTLPILCPSENELQQLLAISLQMERDVYPNISPPAYQQHVDGFQARASDQSFCWVDVGMVLADPDWRLLFSEFK